MSNRPIHIILQTIVISLIVLLRAGAEELESAVEKLADLAFSKSTHLSIPMEEHPDFYLELSEDANYSNEFREYAGKRYRLSVIRQNMLDLLQGVHDQKSAEAAVKTILAYDQEVADMDTRQAFIKAKRKANKRELYLLAYMMDWEGMEHASLWKRMLSCIKDKDLYRYGTLKRELNPRLHSYWNHTFYMPSFYVATEPILAAYKDIHEDATCSAELREFAARCLKLNDIRNKMLEAVSTIHDETSAIETGNALIRYSDEIVALDMLSYYIEIKDKLSEEEQKKLDQMLRRRYDEVTAFMTKYLRLWEEKGLEQYESKVKIIRDSVSFKKYHALWTDYMYPGNKPGIQLESSVEDLIFELEVSHYLPVLFPHGSL